MKPSAASGGEPGWTVAGHGKQHRSQAKKAAAEKHKQQKQQQKAAKPAQPAVKAKEAAPKREKQPPRQTRFGGSSDVVSIAVSTAPAEMPTLPKQSTTKRPPEEMFLLPRGIANQSGTQCFMNALLQALLACESLHTLAGTLAARRAKTKAPAPVTCALSNLLSQVRRGSAAQQEAMVGSGAVYNVALFHDNVLGAFYRATGNVPGMQQDAQELYSFFVSALQNEHAVRATTRADADEASTWKQVDGRKRRILLNAESDFDTGPVASVFSGCLESAVTRKPGSAPTVSVQPFECVHLDISPASVTSVAAALEYMRKPEALQGGMRRTTAFVRLPRVLCLHLKRFVYDGFVSTTSLASDVFFLTNNCVLTEQNKGDQADKAGAL